jgi:hypothetical protein
VLEAMDLEKVIYLVSILNIRVCNVILYGVLGIYNPESCLQPQSQLKPSVQHFPGCKFSTSGPILHINQQSNKLWLLYLDDLPQRQSLS